MTGTELGRATAAEIAKGIVADLPEKQAAAMLTKIDDLTTAIKALAAKLDLDSGVNNTNYASLLTDSLSKLSLKL